jgi:hypothetical protein
VFAQHRPVLPGVPADVEHAIRADPLEQLRKVLMDRFL